MYIALTVISMIVMFSLIVGVHEFGHMIFARIFGVKIHEYSIGMGPKMFQFERKGIRYSIRWLLIGGYVSLGGTIPLFMKGKFLYAGIEGNAIRYVGRKRSLKRAWNGDIVKIIPKGVQDNLVFDRSGRVYRIAPDIKLALMGNVSDIEKDGERLFEKSIWKQIVIFIAGSIFNFILGFLCLLVIAALTQHNRTFVGDIVVCYQIVVGIIMVTAKTLPHIFIHHAVNPNLGGAVYIVSVVHKAVRLSFWNSIGTLVLLSGLISVSVGVFNLIPIPPLDGFHIIRVLIGKIVAIPYTVLAAVSVLGITALLAFAVLVNWNNVLMLTH